MSRAPARSPSCDPKTGKFTRIDLENGAGPPNLIVGKNGTRWYSGNRNGYVGKVDPKTGKVTRIPMPDEFVKDPHTLIFDQKGDIWCTAQQAGYVGKLTVATSNVQLVKWGSARAHKEDEWALPGGATSLPYAMTVDDRDRLRLARRVSSRTSSVSTPST